MQLRTVDKVKTQLEELIVAKGDFKSITRLGLTIVNRRGIPLPSAVYRYYNKVEDFGGDMGNENFLLEYMIPERDKCLVDVGANVGGWTFIVAQKERAVYAFEPSPPAYSVLQQRAKNYANVQTFAYALSDEDGTGRIGLSPFALSGTMDAENKRLPKGGTIDIAVRKLDSLKLQNVGVIKIDTEGYETPILAGAKATITKHKPRLIIEVHKASGKAAQTFNEETQRIKSILHDFNYTSHIHYRAFGLHDQQPHIIATPNN
jgi:FkbM family methyltransferase